VALQVLRNRADADDACQEVFVRMYRSFDSFDPTRPLRPWVAKIAYNVCVRQREGVIDNATDLASPEQIAELHDSDATNPERDAARSEASGHLAQAMEVLAADDRALLTLRYREGLSDAEVADAADMPVNTVKTRIFRARARLRKALRPLLQGDEA
jgi:RNA polymerase sigma-70 factor (ECF subfamily)